MKKRNEKNDNIILTMVEFFITEMCNNGIATDNEISDLFNNGNELEFNKMIKEYKKLQNVTRSKANKAVIRLKKENKHLLELQKDMDKQYEELESVLNEVRKYVKDKIKNSFEVDCGISNIRSDRLMTETVVELQLIEEMLNKALEKKG